MAVMILYQTVDYHVIYTAGYGRFSLSLVVGRFTAKVE